MADPLLFLNPDDKNALQQMLTWFKQRRSNLQSRSPQDLLGKSSDTYIAIPTTSLGIPALTRPGTATGTGTFDAADNMDTPGYANCDVYQIVDLGDGSPTIVPLEFDVVVYNLTQSVISQDWVTVTRDRFGSWLAVVGSASGGTVILGIAQTIGIVGDIVTFDVLTTAANGANDYAGETVNAFIRKGMVFPNDQLRRYYLSVPKHGTLYEVLDPDLEVIGVMQDTAVKGGTGDVVLTSLYDPPYHIAYLLQDVYCRYAGVVTGSIVRCRWLNYLVWEVVNAECDVSPPSGTGTGTGTG